MRKFFDPCVDSVIELIHGQLQQIEKKGRRLKVSKIPFILFSYELIKKNIFLIGGFGESEFLQEELKQSLARRKVQMRRPDTS